MQLIDKNELKEVFKRYLNAPHVRLCGEMAIAIDTCIQFLDNAKSVDVVMCAECASHGRCLQERIYMSENIPDPYCCRGKRKDGEG